MVLEYRDLVDLYLFASHAAADAHLRLAEKCRRLNIDATRVAARLDDLAAAGGHHAAGVESVIRQQLDPEPAAACSSRPRGARETPLTWRRAGEMSGLGRQRTV